MAFKATREQQAAIDTAGNVLVSAAAGSGKTAVLTERVIKKLTDKVSPVSADRLLIVTFTNAAAAEMRSRIERRLDEECRKHPDDIGLMRQRRLLSNAKICTIDSFCIDLVRENFEKAGVSPDFKMSDGYSLLPVNESVLSDILKRYYEEGNPDFFKLLDNYKITAITFVPAILDMVLKFAKDRFATYDSQFNYIQMGSAPLSEADKELLTKMFPTVRLYNTYGATESGCTVILEFNKYADKKNCIGRTTVNTTIFFVDENRNEIEASFKNPGYMAFKGDMNMRGYYKEPEITKEALENGNIYTNDLGYVGEDGLVYLLGRKGDVINMGGLKIAPTEIEEVVVTHEKIKDCACIPIKDEITGEAPKLFVVMNEGCEFDQKEIAKFMLNKLEAFKVPKVFEVIDEIPRTFNGKIIRKKLKELDMQ